MGEGMGRRVAIRSCIGVIGLGLLVSALLAASAHAAVSVRPAIARVVGEVERITVKDPNDLWSEATMVVAGQNVTIPRNLLADLPANRLTMQQLLAGAPAGCVAHGETGLAKADVCNASATGAIATIEANRTGGGNVIAGDVFLQKGTELISGTVSFIDFTDGYFRLNGTPGDPDTGVMVRLNDPTTRYSRQQGRGCRAGSENCSPDARFTGDPDNYTQSFSTGYPLCIPSTVPRTFTDVLDLNANGDRGETLTAQAASNGTGDLLCPAANRTRLVAEDSRRFAPLQLDDDVTVQGNFETVGGVRFLSAFSTMVGRALSTTNAVDQPDYMFLNEVSLDAAGFDRNRARDLFIGATTEATSDVVIWSLHRDPATNAAHEFPLATVVGCDAVAGAGTCTNVLGTNTFRVRHDIDFTANRKPELNPCLHLRADPRFTAKRICPNGGTTTEQLAILSPTPREIQARTGRKMADLARAGGPLLKTIDITGQNAPNGQYLFPLGIGLGGIEVPFFPEIDINALGTPTIFSGLPWNLDRRLSPNGCDGACEDTPQPLDPFPFARRDPRNQAANMPAGTYNDPNYTASQLTNVRNRILSFVFPSVGNFDGDRSVLAYPPVDPPSQPIEPTPGLGAAGDTIAPSTPGGLRAVGAGTRQIDLSWTRSTDNVAVTNYLVFRDGDANAIALVGATATTFSDTGLSPGSTHSYAVQAIDAAGNTSDMSAAVTATAAAPRVGLSPTSLAFADQPTGTSSTVRTVTVTNTGDADLSIATAALGGRDAADFAKGIDGCTAATVAPADSCTVEVRFAPATPGAKTATLSIGDNSVGGPHSATLGGTATSPPAPAGAQATPAGGASAQTLGAANLTQLAARLSGSPARAVLSLPTLALSGLQTTSTVAVSSAQRTGLAITALVPAATKLVRVRVVRISGSRRTSVYEVFLTVEHGGKVRLRLRDRALRRALRPGTYRIEVAPGRSVTDVGKASRVAVRIVRR
jgi:hypothetical protein